MFIKERWIFTFYLKEPDQVVRTQTPKTYEALNAYLSLFFFLCFHTRSCFSLSLS